jgi:hypothetical protein
MTKCRTCGKRAIFGEKGGRAEYCKEHSPFGYVDVANKTCLHEKCTKKPVYGKPGNKKREYCKEHSPLGYVNVVNKACLHENCDTRPVYGKPGSKKKEYCKDHSPLGYVDVANKTCLHENCTTRPSYGKPGSKKREYCKEHSPFGCVDVANKTCLHENCTKQPIYGKPGSKKAEYCKEHAPGGYVNVVSKTCLYENCDTIPVYGKPGSKKKEYCKEHAPGGYMDVVSKTCLRENCDTIPVYGKPGSKKKEYCKEHAPGGYMDVANKTCIQENCTTRSSYSYPGYSAEYCAKHKLPRMVIHPLSHPKEEDILCTICCNPIHYNEQYCSSCKTYLTLKTTVKRKQKELEVKTLLEEAEIKFTHDEIVVDGCSRKRPDFLIPTKYGTIILEVDEFQHMRKNYPCECEITRMKQIYYDVGERHAIFIRYNPDTYKCDTNHKADKKERQQYLIKFISEMLDADVILQNNLAVVYLFYDHFVHPPEIERIEVY